jgi:hypothetical protein
MCSRRRDALLKVKRHCADDVLDGLDGIAVACNFARIACFDVQDDVLETTVGLATSRKVPLRERASGALR